MLGSLGDGVCSAGDDERACNEGDGGEELDQNVDRRAGGVLQWRGTEWDQKKREERERGAEERSRRRSDRSGGVEERLNE